MHGLHYTCPLHTSTNMSIHATVVNYALYCIMQEDLLSVIVAVRFSVTPFLGGSGVMVMLSTFAGSDEEPG